MISIKNDYIKNTQVTAQATTGDNVNKKCSDHQILETIDWRNGWMDRSSPRDPGDGALSAPIVLAPKTFALGKVKLFLEKCSHFYPHAFFNYCT